MLMSFIGTVGVGVRMVVEVLLQEALKPLAVKMISWVKTSP